MYVMNEPSVVKHQRPYGFFDKFVNVGAQHELLHSSVGFFDRLILPLDVRSFTKIEDVPDSDVFQQVIDEHFGDAVKQANVEVRPGTTLPRRYVEHVNSMQGLLCGGIEVRTGRMTLEQNVQVLDAQQGACTMPPIDLGTTQTLYGKLRERSVELLRVCPYVGTEGVSSIEYMVKHLNPGSKQKSFGLADRIREFLGVQPAS